MKLVTAMGLLAVLASPVLARASAERHDAPPAHTQSATPAADAVILNGKVIGQDPDPNVRLEIKKDAYVSDY